MRNLIVLFLFILSLSVEAGEIVVISSLENTEGKRFWNNSNYSVEKKLQSYFKKGLPEDQIRFITEASFKDVYTELTNPHVTTIFFIGHGASGSEKIGLSLPSAIFDKFKNPIQEMFFKANNNLRFLAVISCNSKGIIEEIQKKKNLAFNPELEVVTFDESIELKKGIFQSIETFQKSRHRRISKTLFSEETNEIRIRNSSNFEMVPSMIYINGVFKGVFSGAMEEELEFPIYLDPFQDNFLFTIVHDRGKAPGSSHFGRIISFESPGLTCEISPELNSKGQLLGATKHYYILNCFRNFTPFDY